jgi:hypothetical protein
MPTIVRTLLVLSVVVLAAAPLRSQRRSDVITAEEIDRMKGKGGTAYDAVESLRPRWLKVRDVYLEAGADGGIVKAEVPHVYLNDVDAGDVDYLKTIPAERVAELRWLSANQAASRYGPANSPGIVVTLKR